MNIPIEVIAIGLPIVLGAVFIVFLTLIKYWRLWRYKPENDKGKKAEEGRRSRLSGDAELATASLPERRSVFQASALDGTHKNKTSTRKPRARKFRRRRKE